MYHIDVDHENKFISIALSGCMTNEEIKSFAIELKDAIRIFNKKEVRVLAMLERLDPIPQISIPEFILLISEISIYIRKISSVHRRAVTRMQMARVEGEVNNCITNDIDIRRYATKKEALAYLNEK